MKSTSSSIDSIPSNVTCAHFSYMGLLYIYTDSIEVPIGAAKPLCWPLPILSLIISIGVEIYTNFERSLDAT